MPQTDSETKSSVMGTGLPLEPDLSWSRGPKEALWHP